MIGDLITIDREDPPIMVVKIDIGKPGHEALQSFMAEFEGMEPPPPFGMFIDLDEIVILERRDGDLLHPSDAPIDERDPSSSMLPNSPAETCLAEVPRRSVTISQPWSRHGYVITPSTGNRKSPPEARI